MTKNRLLRSLRKTTSFLMLILIDSMALLIAFFISLKIRLNILPKIFEFFPTDLPLYYTTHVWWIWILCLGSLAYAGLYTKRRAFWPETRHLFSSMSLALVLIMAVISLAKLSGEVSRTSIIVSYLLALVILPLARYGGKTLLFAMGIWPEKVLILGFNETGRQVKTTLQMNKYLGYQLVGFLTVDGEDENNPPENATILGTYEQAEDIITSQGIRHIVIAEPYLPGAELVDLSNHLQPYTRSVIIIPDLFGLPVTDGGADYLFDEHIPALRIKNNLSSPINILTKRILDLLIAFLLLVPLLIMILILAALIKIDSPGPVFHTGTRIGRKGREFKCYKFRTMYLNNDEVFQNYLKNNPQAREEWQQFFKLRGEDPRVTRIGRFLRKTSLDELPQIINVIKGDMSLVGPRPITGEEVPRFGDLYNEYSMVLPGMTGLWVVSGRSDIGYGERVRLETWYVRNWSLWLDISILFRTVSIVLSSKGAY